MDVLQLALKREIQVWGELTRVEAIKGEREREEARLAADELRKKAAFEQTKRKDAAEKKAFQAEIPAAPQSEWKCDCGACNVEAASVCAMCEAVPGAWEDSDQPPQPQWHEAGDDAWEAVFGSLWTEMTDFFDFTLGRNADRTGSFAPLGSNIRQERNHSICTVGVPM